jgi:hypothetical protein
MDSRAPEEATVLALWRCRLAKQAEEFARAIVRAV